jgi:hypothetical protein
MINAWYAWTIAVDDALFGYRGEAIKDIAKRYAEANGVTVEELEAVRKWINWDEVERHLKERDAE